MSDHLHPEQLLALLDGELEEAELHAANCADCRALADALRSGLDEYVAWHEQVFASLPAPPAPWKELSAGMDGADARTGGRRLRVVPPSPRRRRTWWALAGAAAAALVLAYAGYLRLPSVQAAEILEKAVAAAPPVRPDAPIRMKTRTREFVRPAVLRTVAPADGSELAPLFATAQFDWVEPFGARPFSQWRDRLSDKHDSVECQDAVCLVRTSSASNALSQATLVLRASDLAPVRETLEFRESETVEIWAAPQTTVPEAVPPAATTTPHAASGTPARVPLPVVTLHVLAALHAIRADLGELELHTDGQRLTIRATGLSGARREEIRHALAEIEGVDFALGDDSSDAPAGTAASRRSNQKPAGPAPLRAMLESKLPADLPVEDAVNQILDASDAMMAEAFALRTLSKQYSPEDEAALGSRDRELLAQLRQDYARELRARVGNLARQLAPLLGAGPPTPVPASNWQKDAGQAFAASQALDSKLSEMLAGSPRGSPSPPDLLLRDLEDAVRRAQAKAAAIP